MKHENTFFQLILNSGTCKLIYKLYLAIFLSFQKCLTEIFFDHLVDLCGCLIRDVLHLTDAWNVQTFAYFPIMWVE